MPGPKLDDNHVHTAARRGLYNLSFCVECAIERRSIHESEFLSGVYGTGRQADGLYEPGKHPRGDGQGRRRWYCPRGREGSHFPRQRDIAERSRARGELLAPESDDRPQSEASNH